MSNDTVIELKRKEFIEDQLTDILRQGARKLLIEVLDAEIELFLAGYADLKDDKGRNR